MRQLDWIGKCAKAQAGPFTYTILPLSSEDKNVSASGHYKVHVEFESQHLGYFYGRETFEDAQIWAEKRHNTFYCPQMADMLRDAGWKVEEPE